MQIERERAVALSVDSDTERAHLQVDGVASNLSPRVTDHLNAIL